MGVAGDSDFELLDDAGDECLLLFDPPETEGDVDVAPFPPFPLFARDLLDFAETIGLGVGF